MKKTIKIFAVLFFIVTVLTLCSCKAKPAPISSSYTPVLKEHNINPLNYYSIYCTDNMAYTEIAVNDSKIYCKWLDNNDHEHISVIENIIAKQDWTQLSQQDEIDVALTYFKNYNYQSLKEKIGECTASYYQVDSHAEIMIKTSSSYKALAEINEALLLTLR